MRSEANAEAREAREKAESDASAHVEKVQVVTQGMLTRADGIESELDSLVENLRSTVSSLVDTVRTNASSLSTELADVRAGLAEVREAAPATPEAEPTFEETAEEAAQETAAETAYEAAPELEEEEEAEEAYEEPEEPAEVEEEEEEEEEAEVVEGEAEEEAVDEEAEAEAEPAASGEGAEGARLIALNMALNGTPREETARYLEENFDLDNQDAILDEVYARWAASSRATDSTARPGLLSRGHPRWGVYCLGSVRRRTWRRRCRAGRGCGGGLPAGRGSPRSARAARPVADGARGFLRRSARSSEPKMRS